MPQRILIIEDEKNIADAVAHSLRREGFETATALDGETGLRQVAEFKPDLVILDLMLPGIGGLDLCRIVRQRSTIPIIMLTAKASEVDVVVGLETGADDYVTKPFGMRPLIARVRAALRRREMANQPQEGAGFADAHLTIDITKPSVQAAGAPVTLSPKELSLLKVLLAHRGRVRTRNQLLEEAWGSDEYIDLRTVDVHIRWLRQKLEPDPEHPRYIETVRGLGYRFTA
jgi:DNA-binding response OmpR family regulator